MSTYKGESKLSTWIFKIATNAALDRLKSPSYKRTSSGPLAPVQLQIVENIEVVADRPTSPDQEVIRDEMSDCIREFVDRLPPDYRTIIILNELEGFTNKEIAEKLKLAPDTIKTRVSNILWKTQKKSRKQLIAMAWKTDLVDEVPSG